MGRNKPTHIIVHHSGGTASGPKISTQHHTVAIINETHRQRWPDFKSELKEEGLGDIVF